MNKKQQLKELKKTSKALSKAQDKIEDAIERLEPTPKRAVVHGDPEVTFYD